MNDNAAASPATEVASCMICLKVLMWLMFTAIKNNIVRQVNFSAQNMEVNILKRSTVNIKDNERRYSHVQNTVTMSTNEW